MKTRKKIQTRITSFIQKEKDTYDFEMQLTDSEDENKENFSSTPSRKSSRKSVGNRSNALSQELFSPVSKKREKRARKRKVNEINAEKAVSYIDEMFQFYENQGYESLSKSKSKIKTPLGESKAYF